jgi:hypothetical protein
MVCKKLLYGGALVLACASIGLGAKDVVVSAPAPASVSENVAPIEAPKKHPDAGKKPKLSFEAGDLKLALKGETKVENFFAKNVVMLNSAIPDEFGYWRQVFDLKGDVVWGEKEYGFPALEVFSNIRQKFMWGDAGKSVEAIRSTVGLDGTNVSLGAHSHKLNKPVVWLREGWLQLSWNAIIDKRDGTQHSIKFGSFKFELGRGISLGSIYGSSREFLGIYTGYQNDVYAPGVLLHGDLIHNLLSYDFYYAKLEEKSSNIRDTFNTLKANHVGRSLNPWRGVAKDNDLLAARLQWKAIDSDRGRLDLEPYVLYNIADDRTIEIEADSKIRLATMGLAAEFIKGDFEWGAEAAFNMGRQTAVNLDRNNFNIAVDSSGNVVRRFSHVVTTANTTASAGTKVAATSANVTTVNGNTYSKNGEIIADGLFSASDRFRDAFKIDYRGWMGVFDAAYTIKKIDLKLATAVGIASGDVDPNASPTSGNYEGFIGLQEGYAGDRVPSVFVLDSRKLKRPISLDPDSERAAGDDPSFTDMIFTGGGFSWFPLKHDAERFSVGPNVLTFWKYKKSQKFDSSTGEPIANTEARKYLGTEFNIRVKYEVLKDLAFTADIATFFPGTYYSDTRGQKLRDDIVKAINIQNESGVDPSQFRIGTDRAYLFNFGLKYKF